MTRRAAVAAGLGVAAALLGATPAAAQPADEVPAAPVAVQPADQVLQQVTLTPGDGTLGIELALTPGTQVAGAFTGSIDVDGDRNFEPAETAKHMATVASGLWLTVDGRLVPVTVTGSSYPSRAQLTAGGGAITIEAAANLPNASKRVEFRDAYESGQPEAIEMSVTPALGSPLTAADITRGDDGRTLGLAIAQPARPAQKRHSSPWVVVALIGLCVLLGALRALTPGQGKTMLADRLADLPGTPRHAVTLGALVTAARTTSALLLGAATLVVAHFLVPGGLVPTLKIAAGAAVLAVGVGILRRRARGWQPRPAERWRDLVALVPCPEALAILILGVGLHRTAVGFSMLVAFSLGLAAVLVGLGLILVLARDALAGLRPAHNPALLSRLPVVSAFVVAVLGVAMTATGVAGVV